MLLQDNSTSDPEKRYNSIRRQRSLMNVLRRPVEIAANRGRSAKRAVSRIQKNPDQV
jgi:hypothetical protein